MKNLQAGAQETKRRSAEHRRLLEPDVRRLTLEGKSMSAISRELGIARGTIKKIRDEYHHEVPPIKLDRPNFVPNSKVDPITVAIYLQQGMSAVQVAKKLGVNTTTITKMRNRLSIPAYVETDDFKKALEFADELFEDECPIAEVARSTGLSYSLLAQRYKGRGWTQSQNGTFNMELKHIAEKAVATHASVVAELIHFPIPPRATITHTGKRVKLGGSRVA